MKTFNFLQEDLRKWFSKTDPGGDWKRINSKGEVVGPCAREPGEPKPKCMSRAKRESLTKKERAAAVRAKRKHDPDPERKGEPINVSNYGKGKISEDMENLNEKNVPTNPELWSRAKSLARSKFDVYPSAYANGWASKWYKGKGGSWKSVSEAVKDEYDEGEYDQEGDMAKSDLRSIMANAKRLHDMIDDADNLPEWCQNKITLAEDYISTVANYLTAEMNESDVYGKPTTVKTPTVTLKHKTSGKEIVVTKKSAPGYEKIGYHVSEEFSKTGKEATHNKTGEKTYEYAKVDKEGRKTGEREYRNAQGKPMGEDFAGYIAHYNGQKHEIKSHEAKDLYDAKQKAIAHFKIPKSKHGLLSVKPGVNEEVEQIDEISRGLADRYVSKVTQQQVQKQGMQPNMYDKLPKNRQQGVSNALKRTLVKSPVKEETEQIDELSSALLKKYDDASEKKHTTRDDNTTTSRYASDRIAKNRIVGAIRSSKRQAGFKGNTDKVSRAAHYKAIRSEEVEQIDELSKDTLASYANKAVGDVSKDRSKNIKLADKKLYGNPNLNLKKEETVKEQLYKQGRFVTGAGKKPFKSPTLASPRVEESRGHKMVATFMKNREVAQRAFTGQNKPVEKPKEEKKPVKESRKAEIVKSIMRKKKSDKFEAEPELSNTQTKSDQTT